MQNNPGMENVAYLGGFIENCFVDVLKEKYSPPIAEAIKESKCYGQGIWKACAELESVYKRIRVPGNTYYEKNYNSQKGISNFGKWLLVQDSRCQKLRYENRQEFVGNSKSTQEPDIESFDLFAVEQRVLAYALGRVTGSRMTARDIARLPEFKCKVFWINRIMYSISDRTEGQLNMSDYIADSSVRKERK